MKDLAQNFSEIFHQSPAVVASAPGRLNLIGEHVDYCDGFVLPFAIPFRTTVALSKRNDEKIKIFSVQKNREVFEINVKDLERFRKKGDWKSYVLGCLWALGVTEINGFAGLNIAVDGAVPLGAGLSSSAALEAATALALNQLFDLNFSLRELARLCQKCENDFVGVPCGIMDQSISLLGEAGKAILLDCRDLSVENVPFNIAKDGLELLVIDTAAHHALIDGGYQARRESAEQCAQLIGVKTLRDISLTDYLKWEDKLDPLIYTRGLHVVSEIDRVHQMVAALKRDDFQLAGRLLNESHASLRDLYTVSCPELDTAVESARAGGALGARMVGGGFGGSAIALIRAEQQKNIEHLVRSAFSENGFNSPRFFTATPAAGARVEVK